MIWIDDIFDVVWVQQLEGYRRESAVACGPVNVVKYAAAFRATGLMIRTADAIAPVLKPTFEIEGGPC
jgi:acetolactate synthase-1/2/3 large subunit